MTLLYAGSGGLLVRLPTGCLDATITLFSPLESSLRTHDEYK